MTLQEFFRILRWRWRSVIACTLLVTAIAYVFTAREPVTYTATATVYLQTTSPSAKSTVGASVITSQDLSTYVALLGSPPVTGPLLKSLNLPASYPVNVSASVDATASILSITAVDSNPVRAARIANAVGPALANAAATFSPLLKSSGQKVTATAISAAFPPGAPTSPNKKRNIELGILAGLMLGIGFSLIRNAFDTKVRVEGDLRASSDSPLLANLPVEKAGTAITTWGTDSPEHHTYAEAIRRLRTSLMYVDVTTQGNSFVVTSAVPGEGKSTTTINLALAMAETGARTLLLDGDLRRPTIANTLGLEGGVGLTTLLLGRAELADVVQPWGETSLTILPAGDVPPNPSELLSSDKMKDVFAKITDDYDFVLVDSPPVLPVVDAILLDKLTSGMVVVVAAGRTRKRDLAHSLKILGTSDVAVSGFVLNMVSARSRGKYDHYGYHPVPASQGHTLGRSLKNMSGRRTVNR